MDLSVYKDRTDLKMVVIKISALTVNSSFAKLQLVLKMHSNMIFVHFNQKPASI